jgi:hypothetical protein
MAAHVEGRCDRCSRQGSAVPLSVTLANRPVTHQSPTPAPPPPAPTATIPHPQATPLPISLLVRRHRSGNSSQWEGVFEAVSARASVVTSPPRRAAMPADGGSRSDGVEYFWRKPASTATRNEGPRW